MLKDHRFLGFLQSCPDFLSHLSELQKRTLSNCIRYDLLLRYFWVTTTPEVMRDLEALVVERQIEEVHQEDMLYEIAR